MTFVRENCLQHPLQGCENHVSIPNNASPDMKRPEPARDDGRRDVRSLIIIQLAIILLTGLAAYLNSLHGPFHFDDLGITDKSYLWPRAFASGPRQLVDLTFVLNHLLHGQNVFGYHLVNVAVHLTAALALYGLVHSLLTALSVSFPPPPGPLAEEMLFIRRFIPFASALLFVCHPVQTQAVSYIVQRYASMAALFYLCSLLAFIRARLAALQRQQRRKVWALSLVSLLFAVMAVRCKEIAYTLPLMLVVAEIFLFRGVLLRKRLLTGGLAFLLLALALSLIAQHGPGGMENLLFTIQHSTKEELTYARSDYLLTQFRVVASYLRLLILPVNLNLDYDIPLQKSLFSGPVLSSLLLHLTLLAAALALFIRSGRLLSEKPGYSGLCQRLISFGIVWFYLALAVESSFIPILDVMFEHRLYLPSGGGFLVMAAAAAFLAAPRLSLHKPAWFALAVLCCILTITTIQRNRVWNDDLLLWEDTARKSPNKARVLANLTAAYIRGGMPEKALPLLIRTLELAPGFTDALNNTGGLLDILGIYKGRYDNGRRFVQGTRTIDMRQYNQWFANSQNNLGLLYEYSGNLAAAHQHYGAAVTFAPDFELAWYNLLLLAIRQQDRLLAAQAYQKLLLLNSDRARTVVLPPAVQP